MKRRISVRSISWAPVLSLCKHVLCVFAGVHTRNERETRWTRIYGQGLLGSVRDLLFYGRAKRFVLLLAVRNDPVMISAVRWDSVEAWLPLNKLQPKSKPSQILRLHGCLHWLWWVYWWGGSDTSDDQCAKVMHVHSFTTYSLQKFIIKNILQSHFIVQQFKKNIYIYNDAVFSQNPKACHFLAHSFCRKAV